MNQSQKAWCIATYQNDVTNTRVEHANCAKRRAQINADRSCFRWRPMSQQDAENRRCCRQRDNERRRTEIAVAHR